VLVQRNRGKRELPLSVPNSYRVAESEGLRRLVGREIVDTRRVRALVMNGTALIGIVLGRSEVSLPAARTPAILLASTGSSRDPSVIVADDSIVVRGYGFLPGTNASGVDIRLDDYTVAKGIEVRSDGTFSAKVPVIRGPGPVEVSATQRDGNRTTVARAVITVAAREHDENP
jgi:Glucodextranase, domain B